MTILGFKIFDSVIQQYYCCFCFFFFCVFLSCVLVLLTYVVSPQKKDIEKLSVYECGFEPFNDSRNTFDVHFYIVGVLFLIFDLEIVYLIPWAYTLSVISFVGIISMVIFVGLLVAGLFYEWKRGALGWSYWSRFHKNVI